MYANIRGYGLNCNPPPLPQIFTLKPWLPVWWYLERASLGRWGPHEEEKTRTHFSLPPCEDTTRRQLYGSQQESPPRTRPHWCPDLALLPPELWETNFCDLSTQYMVCGYGSPSCIHKICIFCCNVKFLLISTIKNAFMKAFTIMAITKKRAEILGAQHEITFESFFNCFQSLYIVDFSFLKKLLKGLKFRSEACIYMHKLPKSQRLFFFLRAKGTLEFNRNRWLIALGKWQWKLNKRCLESNMALYMKDTVYKVRDRDMGEGRGQIILQK